MRKPLDTIGKPGPGYMCFDFPISRAAFVRVYAASYATANVQAGAYFK